MSSMATSRQMRRKAEEDALARAQAEAAAQAEARRKRSLTHFAGILLGSDPFWHRNIDSFMFKKQIVVVDIHSFLDFRLFHNSLNGLAY